MVDHDSARGRLLEESRINADLVDGSIETLRLRLARERAGNSAGDLASRIAVELADEMPDLRGRIARLIDPWLP